MALKIILTGVVYAIVGPLVTLIGYRLLAPASARTLETGLVFLDTILFTMAAFAIAGLIAGAMAAQGFTTLAVVVAASIMAISLALWLVPMSVSLQAFGPPLIAGALIAGGAAYLARLIRVAAHPSASPR